MKKIRNKNMLIVDAHTHVWEHFKGQRLGESAIEPLPFGKAKQGDKIFQLLTPEYEGDAVKVEVLLGYMEYNDVDKAVIIQNPCYGDQREYVADIVKNYPEKFVGIGMLDPRDKSNIEKEIDTLVNEFKFKGVKMEIPDTPFMLDDPEYSSIWEKVMENDCFVVIDLGWGEGLYAYDHNIDRLKNVLKKYPNIKMVLPHLGVSRLWDINQKYPFPKLQETFSLLDINKENLWFDCSAVAEFEPDGEYPYYRSQEIIKTIKERWGMDRIMWGTDFPTHLKHSTYRQFLDFVIKHCDFLTESDLEMVLGKNAIEVYFKQ
jgi:predicted TIM-barrel fold metal-dependent hydrolase